MKRMLTVFPVFLLLLSMLLPSAAQLRPLPQTDAQKHQKAKSFLDIQRDFYGYWKGRDSTQKGRGWKQFKRWEWFWTTRLMPDGTLPPPSILYDEWQKEQAQLQRELIEEQRKHGKRGAEKVKAGTWTLLGPDRIPTATMYNSGSGRINCLRIVSTSANTMWIGTAGGGIWKTVNGGAWWTDKSSNVPILGVSDIAIGTTGTVFIATGDADGSMSHYPGYSVGVMKSTDDGATWNTTALSRSTTESISIYRILMHPSSSNTVLAGGTGGIWMITSAGAAVQQVFATSNTRITDMEFHPTNPSIVYAGGYNTTIATASVYRSADAGLTWSRVLVATSAGRVALAVSPASANIVYALFTTPERGFRSIHMSANSGAAWTTQATLNVGGIVNILGTNATSTTTAGQGFYDLALAVSPVTASYVYVGGINVWMSNNSGVNWAMRSHWSANGAPYMHADHHDLVFYPGSPTTMFSANDGGLWKTTDGTTSWSNSNLNDPLSIMQFYRLGCSATSANLIVGGAQDNGTNLRIGATTGSWQHIYDGDGMECIIDYSNSANIFTELQNGKLQRSTDRGVNFTSIQPANTTGAWVTPYVMHPTSPQTLFVGYKAVYRTVNSGTAWSVISTADNLGDYPIHGMAIAPSNPDAIVVMSTSPPDSPIRIFPVSGSTNAMAAAPASVTWASIMTADPIDFATSLPLFNPPTYAAFHSKDHRKLWITYGGYEADKKVFYTSTFGAPWKNYSEGLPNLPANCIVYQKNSPDVLYVGTDLGVYYRHRNMKKWEPFKDGLPNTIITELEIQEASGKLRVSTYGRGIWESPIYQPPNIMLYTPNGGERWLAGNTYTIEWYTHSTIANIKIEYSVDNGMKWTTIASTTSATTGTYSWTVPNVSTTQALVRITDVTMASVSDVSDTTFTIEQPLRLLAPNGGESIPIASTTAIRWAVHTQATVTTLTIQCRLSTTAAWTTIATVPSTGTSGTYIWRTPVQTSTQAAIRIVAITTASFAPSDESDSTFSLVHPLRVIAPNGGERIAVTSATGIRWELHTQATVTSLTFQYRLNPADSWTTITTAAIAPGTTTGTQPWTTPTTATAQAMVRILYVTTGTYITSASTTAATTTATIEDTSDAVFSLVKLITLLFPNGGQNFPAGMATSITWDIVTNANVGITQISIEYSTNAGASWTTIIAATTAATGSYPWVVPSVSTTQALVRLTCTTNANWGDTGDNVFTISTAATCANEAADLDGTNGFLDASGVDTPAAMTLEAWVVPHNFSSTKSGVDSSEQYILFRRNSRSGAGNEAVALIFDEVNNLFKAVATSAGGSRTIVSSPKGSAGLYTRAHIAVALDNSEISLYLNGRLQGRKSTGYSIDYADSVLLFGRTSDAANDGYFGGIIDEVRFWNAVRSESNIYGEIYSRHLAPQVTLAGYWHFDNATLSGAPDASGGGHTAVLHNSTTIVSFPDSTVRFTWRIEGPGLIVAPTSTGTYSVPAVAGTAYTWSVQNGSITTGQGTHQIAVQWDADSTTLGHVNVVATPLLACTTIADLTVEFVNCQNYALSFNGWSDKVDIVDSKIIPGQNFTLEAWINPSSTYDSTMRCILGSAQLSAAERPPILAVSGTSVVFGFGDGTTWLSTSADSVLSSGIWQHVAATFDGTTAKIFVNGTERHTSSVFSGATPFPAPIGFIGNGEGAFYGALDEVRVWNSARAGSAIRDAMYCRFAAAQSGMLAYWKFDEQILTYKAHDIAAYNDGRVWGAWRIYGALPAPPITGPDSVVANTGGHVYCVAASACNNYAWSIFGGTITSGQNTNCVTVDWGSGPYGMLSVSTQAENSCGSYASHYVVILPPPIIVVHPDSSDTVTAGMMSAITWSQSYSTTTSTVSIELSTDGGANWSYITTATPSFYGTNSYSWIPPAVTTSTALVRIVDVANSGIGDTGGLFKIILYTLWPPGTVSAMPGDGYVLLSWTPSSSSGVTGYNIYVRPEWSGSFSLRATVGAGTTFFADGAVVNGTRYYYAVTALSGPYESGFSPIVDAVPTGSALALASPNGGETLMAGSQVPIMWKPSSPQDTVALEYSCNNGLMWMPIATMMGGTSYVWTVPYLPTAHGRLRVRNLSNTVSDISDGEFTVRSGYETAVNVRLFLEGPYTSTATMSNNMQTLSYLPFSQPYAGSPFNYFGPETRGSCITDPIVDWVLVDIRSAMNPAITVARTAALLRTDGVLLDESGYPEVLMSIPPGMYYIAIAHRNHLEVMSSVPVYLSIGSSSQYTFTTGQGQAYQVFMPTLKQVDPGVFALAAGEAQHDDIINADDRVRVINALGGIGYIPEDVTMSGVVTALDRVMTENNQFMISQVP